MKGRKKQRKMAIRFAQRWPVVVGKAGGAVYLLYWWEPEDR